FGRPCQLEEVAAGGRLHDGSVHAVVLLRSSGWSHHRCRVGALQNADVVVGEAVDHGSGSLLRAGSEALELGDPASDVALDITALSGTKVVDGNFSGSAWAKCFVGGLTHRSGRQLGPV